MNQASSNLNLKCANLRTAFGLGALMLWLYSLNFLSMMAEHSHKEPIATQAGHINDFTSHWGVFIIPLLFLLLFGFFVKGRKMLTWNNGLMIDGQQVIITQYQFKNISPRVSLIYLKSANRLWVLYPTTSQEYHRFPNKKIQDEETADNQAQVELLKAGLMSSGAVEHNFPLLTIGLIIAIVVSVLVFAVAVGSSW